MTIEIRDRGQVRLLEMRHGKANAIDIELFEALSAALERALEDGCRALVVTGSGFGIRDWHWISDNLGDARVSMRDVTGQWATINLCGPRARDVLSKVTGNDVSNDGLPFLSARSIELGMAEVLAVRIGYVGELGWELYMPQEYAAHVYNVLWQAGEPFGIADAGYRDYTGFRRGAHVVYYGRYYPDFQTVIERVGATEVAARWGEALGDAITTFIDADGRNFTADEIYHVD